MRALVADIGNTHVRIVAWTDADRLPRLEADGWVAAPALATVARLATPVSPGEDDAFVVALREAVAGAGGAPLVAVSVVPRVAALVAGAVPQVRWADHAARLPFTHRLADAAATGADRLCNIAAAVGAGLGDALVVDAGTATTVDILAGGVYLGGVIAPGMAFALEAIGRRAARLPQVPFGEVPLAAAPDTVTALAAGAFHAGVGGVEALVAGLQRRHGPCPVVVTGGLGSVLARPGWFHDPHWTFRGAACLCLPD